MATNLDTSSYTTVHHYTTVLGPIKLDMITLDVGASETVDNPDNVETLLANPQYAWIERVNDDLGGTADGSSVALTGGEGSQGTKTLTLHDLAVSRNYVVMVLGF